MERLLAEMLKENPEAVVVSDVGQSLFSGWGTIQEIQYHDPDDTYPKGAIELIFG